MPIRYVLGILPALLLALSLTQAVAADGSVVGFSPDVDELELYKSPTDEDAALILSASELTFPTAILSVSNNGMFRIEHKGTPYWVISDDLKSKVPRAVDTACDPKMAGKVVAHGKRGAGEGCQ